MSISTFYAPGQYTVSLADVPDVPSTSLKQTSPIVVSSRQNNITDQLNDLAKEIAHFQQQIEALLNSGALVDTEEVFVNLKKLNLKWGGLRDASLTAQDKTQQISENIRQLMACQAALQKMQHLIAGDLADLPATQSKQAAQSFDSARRSALPAKDVSVLQQLLDKSVKIILHNPSSVMVTKRPIGTESDEAFPPLAVPTVQEKQKPLSLQALLTMLMGLGLEKAMLQLNVKQDLNDITLAAQTEIKVMALAEQQELQKKQEEAAASSAACSKGFKIGMFVLGLLISAVTLGVATGPVSLIIGAAFLVISVVDFVVDMTTSYSIMGTVMKPLMEILEPVMDFFSDLTEKLLKAMGAEGSWVEVFSKVFGMLTTIAYMVAVALVFKMGSSLISKLVTTYLPAVSLAMAGAISQVITVMNCCLTKVAEVARQGLKVVCQSFKDALKSVQALISKVITRYGNQSANKFMKEIVATSLSKLKDVANWTSTHNEVIIMATSSVELANKSVETYYAYSIGKIEESKAHNLSDLTFADYLFELLMSLMKQTSESLKKATEEYEDLGKQASGIQLSSNTTLSRLARSINS